MRWPLCFALVLPVLGLAGPSIDEVLSQLPPPEASYLTAEQLADPHFHAKDGEGSCEVLPPEQGAGGPTYRFTVNRKFDNLWDAGFGWSTPKGTGPLKDDILLVTFEARSVAQDKGAKGSIRAVLRRTVQPFNLALGETCNFSKQWQRFNLAATPEADLAGDGMLLTFNLGSMAQQIEVRDVRVLNFGKSVLWAPFLKTIGASRWRSGRRIVGTPLTPGMLWEMTAFADLAPTPPDFSPAGAWQATYAIFSCHGYLAFGNEDRGVLRLARIPQDDGTFVLKATQQVGLEDAMSQLTEATIRCRNDALATPISWTLKSQFFGADGKAIPDLTTEDRKELPKDAGLATGDWCLFEAVQRLTGTMPPTFTLLEGMDLAKTGQQLVDRGEETYQIGKEKRTFHRYDQLGHGVLPINYWLDGKGRLQVVVTLNRAYILDPEAETKYEEFAKDLAVRHERAEQRRQAEEE